MAEPLIIAFTQPALDLAQRLSASLEGDAVLCGPEGADAKVLLPEAFGAGRPIVGICAAGILIRHLAPLLGDKQAEPPVIALSADGRNVVPLLGGHRGANRLAGAVAELTGGNSAITTGSDSRFGRALDDPPPGYILANPRAAKKAMKALIEDASIALDGEMDWIGEAGYPLSETGTVKISVGVERPGQADALHYHPQVLVAGMGCERGTQAREIVALLTRTLDERSLAPEALAAIATIDLKADEPGLIAAAAHFGVPLRVFSAAQLNEEADRLPNPSAIVAAEVGAPGVAEAAALKAGPLMVEKRKSKRATCAIGLAAMPVDPARLGRTPGLLHLVGIGPGEAAQRTQSAVGALKSATDWVGYGLYLDLVADLKRQQTEHRFGLGDEEARVRHALELAATGKEVALVCSGDAQIFAMAALAYELLQAEGARALSAAARRVAIETHPGISALQMASARAGALIGHDFCAISLSDLLTDRAQILRRLDAAAAGDFVTCFYNPRSQRRTDLIVEAQRIFREYRPPETPVVIARSLGRPDETVSVTTLAQFDVTKVDMMTIVLFGASTSKAFVRGDGKSWAYTPRGYAKKALKQEAQS